MPGIEENRGDKLLGGRTPFDDAKFKRSMELLQRDNSFLSIYPTLCDLAGLPIPKHVEGVSAAPLLKDPAAAWDQCRMYIPAAAVEAFGIGKPVFLLHYDYGVDRRPIGRSKIFPSGRP